MRSITLYLTILLASLAIADKVLERNQIFYIHNGKTDFTKDCCYLQSPLYYSWNGNSATVVGRYNDTPACKAAGLSGLLFEKNLGNDSKFSFSRENNITYMNSTVNKNKCAAALLKGRGRESFTGNYTLNKNISCCVPPTLNITEEGANAVIRGTWPVTPLCKEEGRIGDFEAVGNTNNALVVIGELEQFDHTSKVAPTFQLRKLGNWISFVDYHVIRQYSCTVEGKKDVVARNVTKPVKVNTTKPANETTPKPTKL